MNILTFDTEEWFHLLDCNTGLDIASWDNYEVRIYENIYRILNILDKTNTKATFFVIGWVAEKYPELVKMISEKYEIGSHTMTHQLIWQQSPKEFRADMERSVKVLQDITGKQVKYFRAPGFSLRQSEAWAYEILADLCIEVDCSVFPAAHAHGGMPNFKSVEPSWIESNKIKIKELPISPVKICGKQIIYSGGGYFRLFPYSIIKNFTHKSGDYVMSYVHPRDLDAGQPVLQELSATRKFKSYVGLKGAEKKLTKWLTDFKFVDIATANDKIDWDNAPIIKL